jgi:hypothetical protein
MGSETGHWRYAFKNPPGVNGMTESWVRENYRGSWWVSDEYREVQVPVGRGASDDKVVIGANPALQRRFNDGIKELMERLKNKNCANFFGGKKNAMKALKKLSFEANSSMLISTAMSFDGDTNKVYINATGVFMANQGYIEYANQRQDRGPDGEYLHSFTTQHTFYMAAPPVNTDSGQQNLFLRSDTKTAAFYLMHELAHAVGAFGETNDDGYDFSGTPKENEVRRHNQGENNKKIWNACFKNEGTVEKPAVYQ